MLDDKDPALEQEVPTGLTDESDAPATPPAEKDPETPDTAESQDGSPETPDTLIEDHEIFLEGEEIPPPAPKDSVAWARLRKAEQAARLKAAELERKLADLTQPTGITDPGPEPTIEDCDYDQVVFKERVRQWDRAVAEKKAAEARQAEQVEAQKRSDQAVMTSYEAAKAELSKQLPGYAEAEKAVGQALGRDAQHAILSVAENPAKIVYTLGQRPELLGEFAKETNRDRFIAKLVKLEARVKMQKKGTPPPEKPVRGTGAATAGTNNSTLEKLRAEAEKTGDYSKVNAWKREQKRKQESK